MLDLIYAAELLYRADQHELHRELTIRQAIADRRRHAAEPPAAGFGAVRAGRLARSSGAPRTASAPRRASWPRPVRAHVVASGRAVHTVG